MTLTAVPFDAVLPVLQRRIGEDAVQIAALTAQVELLTARVADLESQDDDR